MKVSRRKHLFVFAFVVAFLVMIETLVYFYIAEPIEAATSLNIIEDMGKSLSSTIGVVWKPSKKDIRDLFPTTPNPGNRVVIRKAVMLSSAMLMVVTTLLYLLHNSTTLGNELKSLVIGEVLIVCVAFFAFDYFFFRVIVSGTEPATASGLLDRLGVSAMKKLTLQRVRLDARCATVLSH